MLWDINTEANETTADMVREHGVSAHTYTVDLSSREDIYRTANKVRYFTGCRYFIGET